MFSFKLFSHVDGLILKLAQSGTLEVNGFFILFVQLTYFNKPVVLPHSFPQWSCMALYY